MVEPTKTIGGEPGDTLIRASDRSSDRVWATLASGLWVAWGAWFWYSLDDTPTAHLAISIGEVWATFAFWLFGLALASAGTAWTLWGVTRISVRSDELVVRRCLGNAVMLASDPIKLATISDVNVEERKGQTKGRKYHYWQLKVRLIDGSMRRIAAFENSGSAEEFVRRHVRAVATHLRGE